MIQSSDELIRLAPADVERRIAGAKRRRELAQDDLALLVWAIVSPHLKTPMRLDDLTGGRPIGSSQVPGYDDG